MNRLKSLTADRSILYSRALIRWQVKPSADLVFALVDTKQRIARGWFPTFDEAFNAKLDRAEEAAGRI